MSKSAKDKRAANEWYKNNPDKRLAKQRSWHRRNRNKPFIYKLKSVYGLTLEQYEAMYAAHKGVCAICKNPEPKGRSLHIDHCHETGKIRGLLCSHHNHLLGFAQDSILILESAIMYLQRSRQ